MSRYIPASLSEAENTAKNACDIESERGEKLVGYCNIDETTEQIERRTLEAIIQFGRYQDAFELGVSSLSFTTRKYSLVWRELERQNAEDGEPDFFTAKLTLKDHGAISLAEFEALDLDDFPPIDSTGSHVKTRIKMLIDAANKRSIRGIIERAASYAQDGAIEKSIELIEKVRKLSEAMNVELSSEIDSRKYDPSVKPKEKLPLLALKGTPIIRRGNISTLVAPDKAGKSHVMASMIRTVSTGIGDLGFTTEEVGKVVYIDMEQDSADFWSLMHYQAQADPDMVKAYRLTGMSATKSRKAMWELIKKHSDAALFAIDGYADLIGDVNDSEESNEFVAELMALADKSDCAIIGVLHLNPGSEDKSRGHLGSQLGRKSETVLKIKIEGNERHLFTQRARKKPITELNGLRFAWYDDHGGFREIQGTPGDIKQAANVEDWTRLLYEIQSATNSLAWKYGKLVKAIENAESVKERTAKKRVKQWHEAGLLKFDASRGNYTSNLSSASDDD